MKYPIASFKISNLGGEDYLGDSEFEVQFIAGLNAADNTCITFYKGDDVEQISNFEVGILIVKNELKSKISSINSKAVLFSKNPMLFFASVIESNFENKFSDTPQKESINPLISKHSYVERDVTIGLNSKIFPNVSIFNSTTIGENCVIQSGSVIGGIGMSYVKDSYNRYQKIVHLGNVLISEGVDIGCNVTILRGILEVTKIGFGTKIGNNVNIGHNVIIGDNCYISSGVTIGGACKIGDNCWISPGVSIADHINVGDNSNLGLGSVIIKDVLKDSFYLGNPGRKIRDNIN